MPRPAARLANCYVPLVLNENSSSSSSRQQRNSNKRMDDRQHHELRQLCLETGVVDGNTAIGSSLVELGHTKVLCQVSMNFTHPDAVPDSGLLECKVQYAPHIGIDPSVQRSQALLPLDSNAMFSTGKLHSETMGREASLSAQLHSALVSVLQLQTLSKCALMVHATILQDDGSVLSTCITAASLALGDARVEMIDLVTSCTVAVLEDDDNNKEQTAMEVDDEESAEPIFLADPTEAERLRASAVICLAMTPNMKEVTLWSQSGRLDATHASQAIDICRNGCRTMHKFMREAWVAKQVQQQ
jgi:exosome complex component MTR3